VKVIAGEFLDAKSSVFTRTPTFYLDFKMPPNTSLVHQVPEDFSIFAYTLSGETIFSETEAKAHSTVLFTSGKDQTSIKFETKDSPSHFVLIGGKPLKEPVAHYGPFVMNT